MLTQTDTRWKNIRLGKSDVTIGQSGCLLTSLCNIYNENSRRQAKCPSCTIELTPDILNKRLMEINGITAGGLVIWDKACKVLKADIRPFDKDFDMNFEYHIVGFINEYNILHFCNVVSLDDFCIVYDVYTGDDRLVNPIDIKRYININF